MTRFRFGTRSVPGQHAASPGTIHGIIPSNAGIAKVAQDRIDAITAAAARRSEEAIAGIDSVRLYIFQPLTHGINCACGVNVDAPSVPNGNILGIKEDDLDSSDDFKGRLKVKVHNVTPYETHVAKTPASEPDHNYSIDDVLGYVVDTKRSSTSGTTDPYVEGSTSTGPREGLMHSGNSSVYLHEGSYDHEVPETSFSEELISEYEQNSWDPDSVLADNAYVLGGSLVTCPICLGTGIVGGYSLFGATRLVLTSVNATGGDNAGYETIDTVPVYTLNPGDTIIWGGLSMSNYFKNGWAIAKNMRKSVDLTIEYSLNGTTWKAIALLQTDNAINLSAIQFRVTNNTEYPVDFTHVDLVVFHTEIRGQVTNFNQQAGISTLIKGDAITVSIPPTVGLIDRNSLIGEDKYRLMWRVTTLEIVSTAKNQIMYCNASSEVLEPTLVETTLFPRYNVNGPNNLVYGAGVEPIMGIR